ncbi:MAG: TatD family deoxyribonuclease [Rhodospirillaceae bacterium]|nr:TatD family deoxyribonuclease [Rhodospirillaceae bacterium]
MLVDTHCHLDFPDFAGELGAVKDRARAAGVGAMVTIGTKLSQFAGVRAIAEAHDDVFCSVGVHPHEAEAESVRCEDLLGLAAHAKVVGIGETGLDYYYDNAPRTLQQANFDAHIAAAMQSDLPLIVHSRDADADTIAMLREGRKRGALKGVLHCFSSSRELAEQAVDIGFYISLSGILTFKSANDLRETVRVLPLDRLLVETDAPYLSPVPLRGKRNEPAFIVHTAGLLAELKGVSKDEAARATTANFLRLFDKVSLPWAASA